MTYPPPQLKGYAFPYNTHPTTHERAPKFSRFPDRTRAVHTLVRSIAVGGLQVVGNIIVKDVVLWVLMQQW